MRNVGVYSAPRSRYNSLVYGTFYGIDLASAPQDVRESRSPDMLNMYIENGVPKKRMGWETLHDYGGTVLGLHSMPGALLVHVGYRLYAFPTDGTAVTVPDYETTVTYRSGDMVIHSGTKYRCISWTKGSWDSTKWAADSTENCVYAGMNASHESTSFYMNGALFLLDGKRYSKITKNGTEYTAAPVSDSAYVPLTGVSGYWDGSVSPAQWTACVPNEEKNLLTAYQMNTFCGDGSHTEFWLTERSCTVTKVELLDGSTMEWEETSGYSKSEDSSKKKSKITFSAAPAMHPDGAGLENIRVTFCRSGDSGNAGLINACTLAASFGYFNDNRVFLSGNSDYPNRDWASGTDDPSYMEENGWANIGSDAAAIIGYLHYGDTLAIMKEDNNTDAEIYIRSGAKNTDGRILFPVQQGVKGVGAVSNTAFANLRDDALFLAKEGVYAIVGTDASQQKTVQNRSRFVDPSVTKETHKENAAAVVWDDRLLVCFPDSGRVYVADARMKTDGSSDTESYGYEWCVWDNIRARFFVNDGNALYFVTSDGKLRVFRDGYTDDDAPINAYWCTKEQNFGAPGRYKTMLKRGTHLIAETGGQLKMTAVTEDGDTVLIDGYTDADGVKAIAARKVVPKFRTLKLKVENGIAGEGLGIGGISIQYAFGHWVK